MYTNETSSRALRLTHEKHGIIDRLPLLLRNIFIVTQGLLLTVRVGFPAIRRLYWYRNVWPVRTRRAFIWGVAHLKWAPKLLQIARVDVRVIGRESHTSLRKHSQRHMIYAPTHSSMLEVFAMVSLVPDGVTIAIIESTRWPIIGQAVRWGGQIVVDRANHVQAMQAVRDAEETISSNLLIYPEGTRTRTGALGKFKHGAAKISIARNMPVVPVAISGGFESLPKRNPIHLARRPYLIIEFGSPLMPRINEAAPDLTERIRSSIEYMLEGHKDLAPH